jgi:hypothetical protein
LSGDYSADADDYWNTIDGLEARAADLAHDFSWRTLAEAMTGILQTEPDVDKIIWATMGDDKVCVLCKSELGNQYGKDDLMLPDMPAHVLCRCEWILA